MSHLAMATMATPSSSGGVRNNSGNSNNNNTNNNSNSNSNRRRFGTGHNTTHPTSNNYNNIATTTTTTNTNTTSTSTSSLIPPSQWKLNPTAVRERVKAIQGCQEILSQGDTVLSFMVGLPLSSISSPTSSSAAASASLSSSSTISPPSSSSKNKKNGGNNNNNNNPVSATVSTDRLARINIFVDTGTVGTSRVLDGKVRQTFRRNISSLDVVERLIRYPEGPIEINEELIGVSFHDEDNTNNNNHDDDDDDDLLFNGIVGGGGRRRHHDDDDNIEEKKTATSSSIRTTPTATTVSAGSDNNSNDGVINNSNNIGSTENNSISTHRQREAVLSSPRSVRKELELADVGLCILQGEREKLEKHLHHLESLKDVNNNNTTTTGSNTKKKKNSPSQLLLATSNNNNKKVQKQKQQQQQRQQQQQQQQQQKDSGGSPSQRQRQLLKNKFSPKKKKDRHSRDNNTNNNSNNYDDDVDDEDDSSGGGGAHDHDDDDDNDNDSYGSGAGGASSSAGTTSSSTRGTDFHFKLPPDVMRQVEQCLRDISKMDKIVKGVATNGKGTVFLYGNGGVAYTPAIPKALYHKLRQLRSSSYASRPCFVSLGTRDRYYVAFNDGTADWKGPNALDKILKKAIQAARLPRCVAFGSTFDTFFVVFDDGSWQYQGRGIPETLEEKLTHRRDRADLVTVNLGPNGEWFLKAENGRMWWSGITQGLDSVLSKILQNGYLHSMDFGEHGSYFLTYDNE